GVEFRSIEFLYPNIAISDRAVRVGALKRKGALAQFSFKIASLSTRGLGVLENTFSVYQNSNAFPFNDDLLCPPFFILRCGDAYVYDSVKAAGLNPITMSVVHL